MRRISSGLVNAGFPGRRDVGPRPRRGGRGSPEGLAPVGAGRLDLRPPRRAARVDRLPARLSPGLRGRRPPPGGQTVPRADHRPRLVVLPRGLRADALEGGRPRVPPGDRRHRRRPGREERQGRPLGPRGAQRRHGASLLLRPLVRQETGQEARGPRPRQLLGLHRHRPVHQGRPDRHGSQQLDRLRHRPPLEHHLRPRPRARASGS